MKYLFELGNNKALSIAEISAVLQNKDMKTTQSGYFLIVETETIDAETLMQRLGGTKKIAVAVGEGKNPEELATAYLQTIEGKIHFSFSGENAKKAGITIKKAVKAAGRSVRYIEAKNTATILHNNLIKKKTDLTFVKGTLFVTEAIQPIEDFTKRDRERPDVDSKSGMLPPKLARIMVNLAGIPKNAALLDPFCGSGTVLTEAADMGFTTLRGTDISKKAVQDTRQNLKWIKEKQQLSFDAKINHCNVQALKKCIEPNSIDAIVAEPYMGIPLHGNESELTLEKQVRELTPLFAKTFEQFAKVLKKDGVSIFIVPQFRHNKSWITIDVADAIKKAGLTIEPLHAEHPTILYYRDNQHVGRMIYKLKK